MLNPHVSIFMTTTVKLFFILTPFSALSLFLALTRDFSEAERKRLAWKVLNAIIVTGVVIIFFGGFIFSLFGITLDAFRIGAGIVLFFAGFGFVKGSVDESAAGKGDEIAVVPLAVPMIVGPGTIGALFVISAEAAGPAAKLAGCGAFACASVCVGLLLYGASSIERFVGGKWISILSKLTGLMVCAIAAQIVATGVRNIFQIH